MWLKCVPIVVRAAAAMALAGPAAAETLILSEPDPPSAMEVAGKPTGAVSVFRLVSSPGGPLGARVRVTRWTGLDLTGTVVALDDTSLTLRTEDGEPPTVMYRNEVTTIEVSRGHRSRAVGALFGAGVGGLAAVVLAATSSEDEPRGDWLFPNSFGVNLAIGAVMLVPAGVLVGFLIPPAERWQEVRLDGTRRSAGAAADRLLGASLTVGF